MRGRPVSAISSAAAATGSLAAAMTKTNRRGDVMESIREMAPKVAEELTEATKKATSESRTSLCTECGDTGWKQVELEGPRGKYMASKRCECRYEAIIQFQLPQLYSGIRSACSPRSEEHT